MYILTLKSWIKTWYYLVLIGGISIFIKLKDHHEIY
eukprot:UN00261